jgi:hypothetical protein
MAPLIARPLSTLLGMPGLIDEQTPTYWRMLSDLSQDSDGSAGGHEQDAWAASTSSHPRCVGRQTDHHLHRAYHNATLPSPLWHTLCCASSQVCGHSHVPRQSPCARSNNNQTRYTWLLLCTGLACSSSSSEVGCQAQLLAGSHQQRKRQHRALWPAAAPDHSAPPTKQQQQEQQQRPRRPCRQQCWHTGGSTLGWQHLSQGQTAVQVAAGRQECTY